MLFSHFEFYFDQIVIFFILKCTWVKKNVMVELHSGEKLVMVANCTWLNNNLIYEYRTALSKRDMFEKQLMFGFLNFILLQVIQSTINRYCNSTIEIKAQINTAYMTELIILFLQQRPICSTRFSVVFFGSGSLTKIK